MNRESIGKLLRYPGITLRNGCRNFYVEPENRTGYHRNFYFTIRGIKYRIEWWSNVRYLLVGEREEVQIPFDNFRLSGTWPNHFRTNLQFYDTAGEVVCIVPIEPYEKEETEK